jgi:methyl-accepting chemotaxis protein
LQDNQAGDMQASYNQASDMIGQMRGVVDRLTSEIDDATRTIGTTTKQMQQVADVAKQTPLTLIAVVAVVSFAIGVAWTNRKAY